MAKVMHKTLPQDLSGTALLQGSGGCIVDEDDDNALGINRPAPRHSRSFSNISYTTFQQRKQQQQHQSFNNTYLAPAIPPMPSGYIMDKHAAIPQTPPYSGTNDGWPKSKAALPNSDSKYNSHTVSGRTSEHRRARAQRRKTDGSDEIQANIRRPSTAHASPTSRKVTYSQYPDFETIADPFAKRDKIPQKSKQPLLFFEASAEGGGKNTRADEKMQNQEVDSKNNSSNRTSASVRKQQQQKNTATSQAEPKEDSQSNAPTPLKKQDKIPRHSMNKAPSISMALRKQQAWAAEPVQMEPMDVPFPESPVSIPAKPTGSAATGSSLVANMLPISPLSQKPQPLSAHSTTLELYPERNSSLSQQLLNVKTANAATSELPTPVRPFSGRLNSPRLDIDMNKVDTLYARRSLIFEKNKQKREARNRENSSLVSSATTVGSIVNSNSRHALSPGASAHCGELPANSRKNLIAIPGHHSTAATTSTKIPKDDNSKSAFYNDGIVDESCHDDDDDDDDAHKDSEDYIPFDQVLIPTAFKRLRAAIEDPDFEIDEGTYRRFKLSERWYAREERTQIERTFTMGTFGESRKRGRVIQKRPSEIGASVLASPDAASFNTSNIAVKLPNRAIQQTALPEKSDEENIEMAQVSMPPPRLRTASLKRLNWSASSQHAAVEVPEVPQVYSSRGKRIIHDKISQESNHQDNSSPYVPPQQQVRQDGSEYAVHQQYTKRSYLSPESTNEPADQHIQSSKRSHTHRKSKSNRMESQQQNLPEKPSSGCCGCTIM